MPVLRASARPRERRFARREEGFLMDTLQLLRAGRDNIARGWTTGHLARVFATHDAPPTTPSSREACAWCALGAILRPLYLRGFSTGYNFRNEPDEKRDRA